MADRLTLMETYVCVVETGSFSAAARRLQVGQPAVSKAMAQLEERLGSRLLLRSTRGLTPTAAGQSFYDGARRAIEQADAADTAARGAGASLSGRLRICAAVTFARLHIIPRLDGFLDAHPDLSIDLMLDDRNIDLLEEGIDVALRIGELGELGDCSTTARKIARSRRRVIGTPAYFAARGVPALPADLAAHQAIACAPEPGGGPGWTFRRDGADVAVAVAGRVRVTAAEGVRAAVCADLGLAIAPEWTFAPELASGAVRTVLGDWTLPSIDLWAVYPSGRLASAKARAFTAFVQAALAQPLDQSTRTKLENPPCGGRFTPAATAHAYNRCSTQVIRMKGHVIEPSTIIGTAPALLHATALSFRYPQRALFSGLTLSIAPGVTLVRGGDGCGKTALLRLLAGDLAADAGQLRINGVDLATSALEYRRQVCWIDPRSDAFEQSTVAAYFKTLPAAHPGFDPAMLAELIDGLSLAPHLEKFLYMLSTGSKRKVWLAAACASGAPLTLLDEPFVSLDRPSIDFLLGWLRRASARPARAWVLADYSAPKDVALAATIDLGD